MHPPSLVRQQLADIRGTAASADRGTTSDILTSGAGHRPIVARKPLQYRAFGGGEGLAGNVSFRQDREPRIRPGAPANTLPRSRGTAVPIGSSRCSCATANDGPVGKLRSVPVVPQARRADRPLERGLRRPACAMRWQRKARPRRIPGVDLSADQALAALHTVPRNPAQDGRRGDGSGPAAAQPPL